MARRSAPFARIALDYADHPKISGLSDAAFRAHVEMILYARKYKTDGLIPKRIATRFDSATLSELLTNDDSAPSLDLDADTGDYWLHDFTAWQESKEEIEQRSTVNRRSGQVGAKKRWRGAKRNGSETHSAALPETVAKRMAEEEEEIEINTSSEESDGRIDQLCQDLADRMVANGCKKPTITKAWRTAARLILTKDARPFDEAMAVLAWSQNDSFWMTNIQSMPKFRDQYDQLRLKSGRDNVTALPQRQVSAFTSGQDRYRDW